jgi:hypothetical protein
LHILFGWRRRSIDNQVGPLALNTIRSNACSRSTRGGFNGDFPDFRAGMRADVIATNAVVDDGIVVSDNIVIYDGAVVINRS